MTGPSSPVPPGIPHDPGPGQYYASPALAALLKTTPASELGDRYPGRLAGTIGDAALPSPDSLVIIVGDTAAQLAQAPGAVRATSISATPPSGCAGDSCVLGLGIDAKGLDLVLPVVALAMLVPVLVFIATATRLSAARREQRFAAMRLTGAMPAADLGDRRRRVHGGRRRRHGRGVRDLLRPARPARGDPVHRPAVLPRRPVASPARHPHRDDRRAGGRRRRGPAGAAPGAHLPARGHPPGDPEAAGGLAGAPAAGGPGRARFLGGARRPEDHPRPGPGAPARIRPGHGGPGPRRPVADHGRGADHGPADQPRTDAHRRAAAGRQSPGRLPGGQRPGPRAVHHHRGRRSPSAPKTPRTGPRRSAAPRPATSWST